MATRMQQRRGTAQQWTDADPRLESGEIGFETDTNQFKIGDGVNVWSDLSYFKNLEDLGGSLDDYALANLIGAANGIASLDATGQVPISQLSNIIDGAPELLNTINELAAAINDNATFANTVLTSVNAAQQAAEGFATNAIANSVGTHNTNQLNVHGIANTAALVTVTSLGTQLESLSNSIANSYANAIAASASTTLTAYALADSTHASTTSNVHGIADTSALATKTYADSSSSNAQAAAESTAATALSGHANTTSSVHGISNTLALATTSQVETARSNAISVAGTAADTKVSTAVAALTKSSVGLGNVDNTSDASKPVSTATQTALDAKLASATAATTYAPLASPTFTGTVSGVTKTHVGLGNVDNTSDASKPVSTATQTALDAKLASATAATTYETITNVALKAPLASPALTGVPTAPTAAAATNTTQVATTAFVRGEVTALINGASAALDTLGELASALTADEATAQTLATLVGTKAPLASPTFTGTVSGITKSMVGLANVDNTADASKPVSTAQQTALDLKANLASPTFTGTVAGITKTMVGLGSVDNTADTAKPVSTAQQTALDLKAPLASPTFTGTVTVASAGVAFTDGTQSKEGTPSRTPIIQKTASYTLSALTERDSMIEVSNASATTITIPTNATLAYPVGTSIDILQTSTGQVTIAGAVGVTVNATPGLKLRTQWSGATLFKRATDTWVVYGDLSA
jgi:hypothetical protein